MSQSVPAPGARELGRSALMTAAIRRCRPHFVGAAWFSAVINLLYLTPTIFMMQVYDRVMSTGNVGTLIALGGACLLGLGTLASLDWLRSRLLVRVTTCMDEALAPDVIRATLSQPAMSRHERAEALRHFDTFRQSLGGGAILALLDVPWAPIYLCVAFLLHPALGVLSLVACVVLLALAWSNERATHHMLGEANDAASLAYAHQSQVTAYAAEVRALGMREALIARQLGERAQSITLQIRASLANGNHSGIIKFVRLAFQSLALAVGGYLAIHGSISGGSIFAASLLLSKAVQPIEQIVGAWKGLLQARQSYRAVNSILNDASTVVRTHLPAATGLVEVERLAVLTPQNERVALAGVSFRVEPGEFIGVAGLSGSGKSTLLRALAGATAPANGSVRYDGSAYADWDPEQIARQIGYLPQDFALFPGTVKENISRFAGMLGEADETTIDARAIEAAKLVGVHDMIVRLPNGYQTPIGLGGVGLSAGQTQRIALARAFYGQPRILIFDEPNAHLDAEAEAALIAALADQKAKGVTVIIAAHSGEMLAAADKVLILQNGQVARFGSTKVERANLQPIPSGERAA